MSKFATNFLGCLPFSDISVQVALAANTALPYTVPGDNTIQYRCEFSWAYNASVWVGYNVTATVPPSGALTSSDNVSLEFRPGIRYVRGGDVLSFISDSIVANAGFSLLQLPA